MSNHRKQFYEITTELRNIADWLDETFNQTNHKVLDLTRAELQNLVIALKDLVYEVRKEHCEVCGKSIA